MLVMTSFAMPHVSTSLNFELHLPILKYLPISKKINYFSFDPEQQHYVLFLETNTHIYIRERENISNFSYKIHHKLHSKVMITFKKW